MFKILSILCLLLLSQFTTAQQLPNHVPVNGGIAIVPLQLKSEPVVMYKNRLVTVLPSNDRDIWLIVVGIDLDANKSIQYLEVVSPIKGKIPFHINKKQYRTQHIQLTSNKKVTLSKSSQKRATEEKNKLDKLMADAQTVNQKPFTKQFIPPVKGRLSSQYGLKRIYNNKPKNPHKALDIAAARGTPVKATAKGVVLDTGDYFYTGNTVIISHGKGVISLYAHLDKITVHKNEKVKQGDRIGTVGSTGRATGPHLHWAIIVNQTAVNPLLFVTAKQFKPTKKTTR